MCSPSLPPRRLRMWLCCEKYSFRDYCSSRETFCVIIDYPIVYSLLIAALFLKARNVIVPIFLSTDCHWQKVVLSSTNQSDLAAGQMIAQCRLRSLCPKIDFCFKPFTKMKIEWMWEGRCISDEWAADLCKEACKLYLHEQLVVKEQCRVQQCFVFFRYYFWGREERCD